MTKITTIEKQILLFVDDENCTQEKQAFQEMISFWRIYDLLFHTNHEHIISIIYKPPMRRQTNVSNSLNANVSERTLTRYRKKYVETFFAFYNQMFDSD